MPTKPRLSLLNELRYNPSPHYVSVRAVLLNYGFSPTESKEFTSFKNKRYPTLSIDISKDGISDEARDNVIRVCEAVADKERNPLVTTLTSGVHFRSNQFPELKSVTNIDRSARNREELVETARIDFKDTCREYEELVIGMQTFFGISIKPSANDATILSIEAPDLDFKKSFSHKTLSAREVLDMTLEFCDEATDIINKRGKISDSHFDRRIEDAIEPSRTLTLPSEPRKNPVQEILEEKKPSAGRKWAAKAPPESKLELGTPVSEECLKAKKQLNIDLKNATGIHTDPEEFATILRKKLALPNAIDVKQFFDPSHILRPFAVSDKKGQNLRGKLLELINETYKEKPEIRDKVAARVLENFDIVLKDANQSRKIDLN